MEVHLHPADKDHTRRNICEHRKTGCHIIGRHTYKASDYHHMKICRPEYKVMDVQSQRIQEIGKHKRPVLSEIVKYPSVSSAVLPEIASYQSKFQTGDQPETNGQCKKHSIGDTHMNDFYKQKRQQYCHSHTDHEEKGNFLIIFTDRQVQHRIKHQYQGNKSTISGENIDDIHVSHQILVDTERNSKKCTECNIQDHPDIVARKDILKGFLIDDIRHVLG